MSSGAKSQLLSKSRRNSMQATSNTQRSLVLGYLGMRRMIGIIGIMLPIVLVFGGMLFLPVFPLSYFWPYLGHGSCSSASSANRVMRQSRGLAL